MNRLAARLLALALLTGGLVPVMAGVSWACTCPSATERQIYANAAKNAEYVYIGTVKDKVVSDDGKVTTYQVAVTDNIKNGVSSPHDVVTHTDPDGSQCGAKLADETRTLFVELHAGAVSACDGTTQSRVTQRATIVREEMAGNPSPTPTKSKKPTLTASPTPSKSPTTSPSPTLSPTLSVSPSPSASTTTPAAIPSTIVPSSPEPSLNVAAPDEDGMSVLQVAIAAALGLLVLIGGITLMRVTRPTREF